MVRYTLETFVCKFPELLCQDLGQMEWPNESSPGSRCWILELARERHPTLDTELECNLLFSSLFLLNCSCFLILLVKRRLQLRPKQPDQQPMSASRGHGASTDHAFLWEDVSWEGIC